jgi:murein DD-endopeptidase MepM/ murein hydrolase activator NlpD
LVGQKLKYQKGVETMLQNGSFSAGWETLPALPEAGFLQNQRPNGWQLVWLRKGESLYDDPNSQAEGIPECVHKLSTQLPADEQLGATNALILAGDATYKVFSPLIAFGAMLSQTVSGLQPGTQAVLTVPVRVHQHGDTDPYGAESGVWVNGTGQWVNADLMGERKWYYHKVEFAVPANGVAEIVIRVKSKWNKPKDFFFSNVQLQAETAVLAPPPARTPTPTPPQEEIPISQPGAEMVKVSPVTGQAGYPGAGWLITSGYATQAYFDRFGAWHTGHDLAKSRDGGEPIYAVADGKVKFAGFAGEDGFGNVVFIKHNDNLYTRYAHLRVIQVQREQEVSAGQIIGLLGTTGRSTGNHLHFDLMVKSNALDWPGLDRQRLLVEYIDPQIWFNDTFTVVLPDSVGAVKMRVIAAIGLNVRARPDAAAEKLYGLPLGSIVDVKPVQVHANDLVWRELASGGWVAEKYLETVS